MDITAERIKKRRMSLNLSQDDLAQMCGYKSRSSITKIEKNAHRVPMKKIKIIANALLTSPDYLMGWTDNEFETVGGITFGNSEDIRKFLYEDIKKEVQKQLHEKSKEPATVTDVYNFLVSSGYIENEEDLTESDLRFLEAQLSSIAAWFKNKKA